MMNSAVPGPNRNARLLAPLLLLLSSPVSAAPQGLITAADLLDLEAHAPDARISYGEGPELRSLSRETAQARDGTSR